MAEIAIRPAQADDGEGLWATLEPVIRDGLTYPVDPAASRAAVFAYWFAPDKRVFVAEQEGRIVGSYYLKPTSTGPASHVANAGYIVHPQARRMGVARAMALDSFARAREAGYRAMQFNLVVSTNLAAIRLWRSVGMEVVGTLTEAFRVPDGQYVDALVMYRLL